jgi:hypothetical protein
MNFTARREKTLYYTLLIGLVAFASFIMNMTILGSIFNITPSQNAFLAWGVFALALAYPYRLRLLLAAGVICLVIYAAAALTAWSGASWIACVERPEFFLLTALVTVLVPVIARHRKLSDFAGVYRLVGILFLFAALFVLMHESQLSMLPFGKKTILSIYQIMAFVASGAGIWLGIRHRLPETVNLGSASFAIFLFDRLIYWWWDWMPRYLFFFILGLIAVGLLAIFRKIRTRMAGVRTP